MKKRILAALVALTMLLSLLPVTALAEDLDAETAAETEPEEVLDTVETLEPEDASDPEDASGTAETPAPQEAAPEQVWIDPELLEQLPDNDTLFLGYVQQAMYGDSSGTGTYGNYGETLFAGDSSFLTAYRELKAAVAKVASGSSTSTIFTLSVGYNALDNAATDYHMLMTVLMADCPYDLYWYDKTKGYVFGSEGGYAQFTLDVAAAYYDGQSTKGFTFSDGSTGTYRIGTDPEITSAASQAAGAAKGIVAKYQSLSDYDKLVAYKNEICQLVDYNYDALNNKPAYGNPWQLIWVFDGDDSTKVVCEGYSKAFQYLCDLSTFNSAVTCYTVSGQMTGGTGAGAHMWNIVTIGGQNYLVDVTNSDNGSSGQNGGLFLAAPASGSVDSQYNFDVGATYYISYAYGTTAYPTSILTLASTSYSPANVQSIAVWAEPSAAMLLPAEGATASVTLHAAATYSDGTETDVTASTNWSALLYSNYSDTALNGNILTIGPNALIYTHHETGEQILFDSRNIEVTAKYGSLTKTMTITISKDTPKLTSIAISGPDSITTGTEAASGSYTAAGKDQYGADFQLSDSVTWSVSGVDGVTIAQNGTLTVPAKSAAGTVTIKAASGTLTASKAVTITRAPSVATNVVITACPASLTVPTVTEGQIGQTITSSDTTTLAAAVYDQYGSEMSNQAVTWSVSGNNGVSVVGSQLAITNNATGDSVTLTATCGTLTAEKTITVSRAADNVTFVKVNGAPSITIPDTGTNTETYTAKVYNQYGSEMTGRSITWSIAGNDAGVTQNNGAVSVASNAGDNQTVILSAMADSISGRVTIGISKLPAHSFTAMSDKTVTFGDAPFTQTAGHTASCCTAAVTYESSNPSVATVNSSTGMVTIVGAGTATITATIAGTAEHAATTTSYTLTVNAKSIAGAAVNVAGTYTYTGSAQTPAVTVTLGGKALGSTDYEVAYTNNINAGSAAVTVNGKGSYSGTATGSFTIAQAVLTPSITGTATSKVYDGTAQAPSGLSISLSGIKNSDDVSATAASYQYNSADVGTAATITASGITLSGGQADNYKLSETSAVISGTITRANQAAPAAPAATDANIKDTSITLTAVSGAEYSMDGTTWQSSPTFTGLSPNTQYTFYARLKEDGNHNASGSSAGTTITTKKTMLDGAVVTVSGSFTYNGTAQVPANDQVTVKLGSTTIPSSQYGINAVNNTNAGTATVTVTATGDGNYSGTASASFIIAKAPLTIGAKDQTITYGQSIAEGTGEVTSTGLCTGDTLQSITLTASTANVPGGSIIPSAAGIRNSSDQDVTGNYQITYQNGSLTIHKSTPEISFKESYNPNRDYNGQKIDNPAETDLNISGARFSDVTFTWTKDGQIVAAPTAAGTYTLTASIAATNNTESAAVEKDVTISRKAVSDPTIELSPSTFEYDGTAKEPTVTVKDGTTIIPASEYTVTYSNHTNVGTASVTIADVAGNYIVSGSTASFTITAKPIDNAAVSISGTFTYTGSTYTPEPTVTLSGKTLVKDTDYTVSYANNENAGTADVIVTGMGNYAGTANGSFTIAKATLTAEGDGVAKGTYGDTLSVLTVQGLTAKLNGTEVAGTWKLTGSAVPNVGDSAEYTATFTPASGAGNYNTLTAQIKLDIAKAVYSGTTTASTSAKFGATGTYDLTALLPAGAAAGADPTVSGSIFEETPIVSGKTLSFELKAGAAAGETGVITVPVTSTNFEDFNLTITVTTVEKDVPTLTVNAITVTYNGAAVPDTAIKGTAKVGNTTVSGTWTFVPGQALTSAADSGPKAVKFTPADIDSYAEAECTVTVTINKATPTGTPMYTAISTSGKTLADAALTTVDGSFSIPGTVTWTLDPGTEVTANTDYEWVFTPTDTVNYNILTGRIRLWSYTAPSYPSGGGSGGGGSSTSSTSTLPVSTTGQNSSIVTTTTTAVPTANTQGSTATTTVNTTMGSEIVKQAVANNSTNVVIAPSVTGSVTKTEVSIPATTVAQIGSQTNASLTVSTPVANVTIPNGGLGSLSSAGGAVTVTAELVGRSVELSVTAGGQTVTNVPGGVTLTVPAYTTPGTVAMLINADGTREVVRKSVAENGSVTIPLDGSAKLEIVDNSKYFYDVPADNWAADAVAFASSHELFNGTDTNQFSPSLPMSRGMLAVVLYNLESNPYQAFTSVFADVDSNTWYTDGVAWAASNGIVTGYGDGQFGPGDNITREQLAVMLWRYAGSPAATNRELYFADAYQASGWALDALCWATENGVINGKGNGILDPSGFATRAETAQMLKNFMENQ